MLRVFTDPACLAHRTPPGYPEKPERLAGVLARLNAGDWEVEGAAVIDPAVAREAVLALHDEAYVARFERAAARGDSLLDSADNPLSAGTWEAAWAAVSAALAAADWVAAGADRAGFAAARPPGHHAERATAMGFCFFNHVAVAAEHLRRRHGAERVAIFDFDVHHGNGTQHLFEARADVFYASTHQYPFRRRPSHAVLHELPAAILLPHHRRYRRVKLPDGVEMVMPGDNVSVEVELITPIAMEKTIRFAIREGGKTVGAGRVSEFWINSRSSSLI